MRSAMKTATCTFLCIFAALLLAGIALGATGDASTSYVIQKEDVVYLVIWGDQTVTNRYTVDSEGNIQVPLCPDPIHAEGLTQSQLADVVKDRLKEYYTNPQIQAIITEFHRPTASAVGQVARPGLHPIREGDHVMELMAQAGSFTESSDLRAATLTRKGGTQPEPLNLYALFYQGDMTHNVEIKAGDVLYIPEDTKRKFFVLGEVYRPGQYRLKEDMTIMDALSSAGGPTPRAGLQKVAVVRGDLKNPERIEVDMNKIFKKGDLSQAIALKPGDVVYIPETSRPDWSKISGIVSSLTNTTYLFRILGF